MTRHQPEARRRAAIVAAARQIFARDGFERAHLDEIARLAELSKGSLYLHFESKELLYREVLEDALQRWREPWSYVSADEEARTDRPVLVASAREQLRRRFAATLHALAAGQDEAKIVTDAWHRASSDRSIAALLAPHRAALHLELCKQIGLARHDSALSLADVPARAELMLAALIGLMARRPDDASPQGLASDAALTELFLEWACSTRHP